MSFEIVVARYKEDITWTEELRKIGFTVTIYNKSEGENLLPNVGREAHTYLYHIITRWDSLADHTLFLQGNPYDHSTNLFEQIKSMQAEKPDFKPMFINNDSIIMSILCDKNAQPHGVYKNKLIPVGKLYEWLTMQSAPEVYYSTPGAQFLVSKNLIKRRTKKFYERAILSVSYANDPIEAHCFERLWPKIFCDYTPIDHTLMYKNGEDQFKQIGITAEDYIERYASGEKVEMLGDLHVSYSEL